MGMFGYFRRRRAADRSESTNSPLPHLAEREQHVRDFAVAVVDQPRQADIEDAQRLFTLVSDPNTGKAVASVPEIIRNDQGWLLLAKKNDETVGAAFLVIDADAILEARKQGHVVIAEFLCERVRMLDLLAVDEAHRHDRIGETLVGHAEGVAVGQGATCVNLIFEPKPLLEKFYRRLGYEILKPGEPLPIEETHRWAGRVVGD
ncbi:GNAT family N-acetyltransferase [Brevibacterium antiquum]|uniref:GNAT family N-acetyltransferase n=1 Tax=Brevibacterium TaxID=1696 RepID=UPI000C76FCEB|nr:GNAT family N-acetyltransferase [Brevibacterium antiquum]HCG56425.1 N-acetyltransferase [Brevibacterium sp.]